MALKRGEVVFFCADAAYQQMLETLCALAEHTDDCAPRLVIVEADDALLFSRARSFAAEAGVPLLALSFDDCEEDGVCFLRRPFLFRQFYETVCALSGESLEALPILAAEPYPTLPLTWDESRRTVACGQTEITLTPREADVFAALYAASPAPVHRDTLCSGFLRTSGNGAEVYISYLRRKLATLPAAITITAVRGQGYALMMQSREDGAVANPKESLQEIQEK